MECQLARTGDEKGAVRPSVKRVDCDKTQERSVHICKGYHRKEHLAKFS